MDHHFELPRLRDLARRAAPQVIEATLVPLALFYAALCLLGPTGAICSALAWNYLALVRHLWRKERLPGLLVLATVGLTARSIVALASGASMFVYFLQPSLATALVGGAFLLSVPLGRPLAEKLAHDFVPMPATFQKRPKVRQLLVRISLLRAMVSLVNAAGTIALLVNVPIATYLVAKTGLSCSLTVLGIVVSSWWFRRGLRRQSLEPQHPLPSRLLAAMDVERLSQTCQLGHPVAEIVCDMAEVVETGLLYRQAATVRSFVITDPS